MASSRMKSIQTEAKVAEQGGRSNRKNFYNEEFIERCGIKRFKVDEGTHFVAIIPPKDPTSYFGIACSVHYGIGAANDSFCCPLEMARKPCPICEERRKLEAIGGVSAETLSALRPSNRYLFFVVDMKNRETVAQGIQLLEAAFTVQQGIMGVSKNARTGEVIDISDPNEGKTFVFERKGKGATNTKYGSFKIEDRDPLPQQWLDAIPDFSEVPLICSYEEILESFKGVDTPVDTNHAPVEDHPEALVPSPATQAVQQVQQTINPPIRTVPSMPAAPVQPAAPAQVMQPAAPVAAPVATPVPATASVQSASLDAIRARLAARKK